ncbi:MAG: sugar transferase [Bacteroidetes bacterium]|nr:sugar transferase [Bacteroidota bacterium]
MNRVFDILLLLIILPLVVPVFLIIFLFAKIFHGSNVFFFQDRLGKGKRTFSLVKFRSMINGAQYMGTGLYSYADDKRITTFGKFLRTTSLDELPQLINILKGDMSFVGPRPAVVGELEAEQGLPSNADDRFLLKPGLTGWAQIHGRDNLTWRQKIQYDIEFVQAKPIEKAFMVIYILCFTPVYLFNFSSTYEKRK